LWENFGVTGGGTQKERRKPKERKTFTVWFEKCSIRRSGSEP